MSKIASEIAFLAALLGCKEEEIVIHKWKGSASSAEGSASSAEGSASSAEGSASSAEGSASSAEGGEIAGFDDYSIMTVSGYDGDSLSGLDGERGVFVPGAYINETGAVQATQSQLNKARRIAMQREKKKVFSTINAGQSQSYKINVSSTSTTQVLQVSTVFYGRYLLFAAAAVTAGAVIVVTNISINRNVNVLGGQTTTSTTTYPGELLIPEMGSGRWLAVDLGVDEGKPFREFTQSSIVSFSVVAEAASGTPVGKLQCVFRGPMSDRELAAFTTVSTASFEGLEAATRI